MSNLPPPPYGQPYLVQPPRRSNAALWITLGIVGFVVVACCGGGLLLVAIGMDSESGNDEVSVSDGCGTKPGACDEDDLPPAAEKKRDPDAPLGSEENPVPRGKAVENKSARYEVLDVKVEDSVQYAERPSGKYVVVSLSVTNVKDETIQVSTDDFTLIIDGLIIEVDDATYGYEDALVYDDISPGLKKIGTIVFDVLPRDAGKGILRAQAAFSTDQPVHMSMR